MSRSWSDPGDLSPEEIQEHIAWHEAYQANIPEDPSDASPEQARELLLIVAASRAVAEAIGLATEAKQGDLPTDDAKVLLQVAAAGLANATVLCERLVGDPKVALDIVSKVLDGRAHCVPQALSEAQAAKAAESFLEAL